MISFNELNYSKKPYEVGTLEANNFNFFVLILHELLEDGGALMKDSKLDSANPKMMKIGYCVTLIWLKLIKDIIWWDEQYYLILIPLVSLISDIVTRYNIFQFMILSIMLFFLTIEYVIFFYISLI